MGEKIAFKKRTLRAVAVSGKTIKLNITNKGIKKVCIRQGFPIAKHGEKIYLRKKACGDNCQCSDNEATLVGVGVMLCFEKENCPVDCVAKKEDGMAVWVSKENDHSDIFFIDPSCFPCEYSYFIF